VLADGAGVCECAGLLKLQSNSEAILEAANSRLSIPDIYLFRFPHQPQPNSWPARTLAGRAADDRRTDSQSIPKAAARGRDSFTLRNIRSMSGDRGRAGLESDAHRVQMDEFGVGGAIEKFDRLGQQQ
jgi:hypothetical protein